MASFQINKNCEGCGLCAAMTNNEDICLYYKDGYLQAQYIQHNANLPKFVCALDVDPKLNLVIDRYVAYHKQLDRRMDGSAGGVYGAESGVGSRAHNVGFAQAGDRGNQPQAIVCICIN